MAYDVLIVGGGISGLSLAFYLYQRGVRNILLLEKASRFGGKLHTVIEKGYIVETGPNGFLDNKPYTLQLAEALNITSSLYPSSSQAAKRFILKNGKLIEIPTSPLAFFKSPILSLKAKLSILKEPFIPAAELSDETVASFVYRRLCKEFLDYLIDPMVAGIYAGRADQLSIKAAFPAIWQLEKRYGGLIKGMIHLMKNRKRSGPAGPGGTLTSFTKGVQELIDALCAYLEDKIELRKTTDVKEINKSGKSWEIHTERETYKAKALVLSTPAYEASRLLSKHKELSSLLSEIPYGPIAVVALAFKEGSLARTPDGFGFLVPSVEKRKILGCLWDSCVFPNRAPEGKLLMRVMLCGTRQPEVCHLTEEELFQTAIDEIDAIMGVKQPPEATWVFKHPRGIPQYTLGHTERVEAIFKMGKELGGLFFHSNAYMGVGLNDCIGYAIERSQEVKEFLQET